MKKKAVLDNIKVVPDPTLLTENVNEDRLLATLIDGAMKEKGEVKKEKVYEFVKKHSSFPAQ